MYLTLRLATSLFWRVLKLNRQKVGKNFYEIMMGMQAVTLRLTSLGVLKT